MISIVVSYSQSEFEHKYEELRQYKVTIPADPISLGYSGLSNLISKVQGYKDRVTTLMNEALVLRAHAAVQVDVSEHAYTTALDLLINTDIEVINMPSDKTRVARANKKLKVEIEHTNEAKMIHKLIDVYYKTVVHVFNNLESANKNLESQINIYKRMNPPLNSQPTYVPQHNMSPYQPDQTIRDTPVTSGVKLVTEL